MESKITVCYRQKEQRIAGKKKFFFFSIKKPTAVKSNQSKLHISICFLGMAPAKLDMHTTLICFGVQTSSNIYAQQHPYPLQTLRNLVRGCNCCTGSSNQHRIRGKMDLCKERPQYTKSFHTFQYGASN